MTCPPSLVVGQVDWPTSLSWGGPVNSDNWLLAGQTCWLMSFAEVRQPCWPACFLLPVNFWSPWPLSLCRWTLFIGPGWSYFEDPKWREGNFPSSEGNLLVKLWNGGGWGIEKLRSFALSWPLKNASRTNETLAPLAEEIRVIFGPRSFVDMYAKIRWLSLETLPALTTFKIRKLFYLVSGI